MKAEKIIVHCLVANEENFVWYALNSVLPFVAKVMVWDTGSSDKTVALIRSIPSNKIEFRSLGPVDGETHSRARNEMLQATNKNQFTWLLLLDGDEIWPEKEFMRLVKATEKNPPQAVVVKTVNFVGDIYHQQPESAGRYHFNGKVGHYNLRLINLRTPDLHVAGPHGQQGYYTGKVLLQALPSPQLLILDNVYYFHATHLPRSPFDKNTYKRAFKRKYELGLKIPPQLLPPLFFNHPSFVPNVDQKMAPLTFLKCLLYTYPRRLGRLLLPPRYGY